MTGGLRKGATVTEGAKPGRYRPLVIAVDPDRVFRWHCAIIALLSAAHLVVIAIHIATGRDHLLGVGRIFRLTAEANLPTFVSALALVAAALAAALLAQAEAGTKRCKSWALISGLLLFMAFDEASSIHELFNQLGKRLPSDGVLYYAWVVPYAGLAAACAALLLPFLWQLPPGTRGWLAAAGALYCAGAIGMELVEASLVAANGGSAAYRTWRVAAAVTIEELAEMIAVALLLRTLLRRLLAA